MMRKYQLFQCQDCRYEEMYYADVRIGESISQQCPVCTGLLRRRVSFSFHRGMGEHFNHTVGTYVSNERNFKDELKRLSDVQSARTGMEHNYQPVDLRDKEALGVTDEGLYETEKRIHDHNLNPVTHEA